MFRQVRSGQQIDVVNQFELAGWVENAANGNESEVVQALFPLLSREHFSDARWFELERCFSSSQGTAQKLVEEIDELRREAETLRTRLVALETEMKLKETNLRRVRGERALTHKRGISHPARRRPSPIRFTGILIRVGEREGKINTMVKDLGLDSRWGVSSERGLQLLLRAGYTVEVIQGNASTPTGTTFSQPRDLK